MPPDPFVEGVRKVFQEAHESELAEKLIAARRPMVVLTPDWDRPPRPGGTRFGGAPDVSRDFFWPRGDDGPLDFLAQLRLSDLTAGWSGAVGPRTGMLSFFASVNAVQSGFGEVRSTEFRVFHLLDEENLQPMAPPADLSTPEEWTVPEVPLRHARVLSPPTSVEDLWLLGASTAWLRSSTPNFYWDLCSEERRRAFPAPSVGDRETEAPDSSEAEHALTNDPDLSPEDQAEYGEYFANLQKLAETGACGWLNNVHQYLGYGDQLAWRRLGFEREARGIPDDEPLKLESAETAAMRPGALAWCLLFQLDSDQELGLMWGNQWMLQFWILDADLRAGRFDRVRLTVGQ